MKFQRRKIGAVAAAAALGVAAAAQSAVPPSLSAAGPKAGAAFFGGATVNGGASYLPEVPARAAAALLAAIRPDAADVGRTGSLVAALEAPGLGVFNKLPGGAWAPLDPADVRPFATRTLSGTEEFPLLDGLVGEAANLDGLTLTAHFGYYTDGDLADITYASFSFGIAEAPDGSCPANTAAAASGASFKGMPVCVLSGRIESDTHLTADHAYLLDGAVTIGANVRDGDRTRLTIDAGTWVFGQTGLNFLLIDRNGRLYANGSPDAPVIFTYEGDDEATAATTGQWGGIIINGNAPLNVSGGVAEGEGSTGAFGGDDPADSSGSLTYVQVRYAGQNITETNELNGIAFQGTGSGTLVDYVQVHNSSDDGVEFFGGATNARHVLLTGNEDDALDWTFGWTGKAQFIAVKQNTASEHCIEADNNGDNNDAAPRSHPTISNVTCVGPDGGGDAGFRLREGTGAALSNVAMGVMESYCVDIDQAATFANAGGSVAGLNGNLAMTHSRLAAGCAFSEDEGDPFSVAEWYNAQTGSAVGGVDLGGSRGLVNGAALNAAEPGIPDDPFFERVDHIGAIKDEASDWTRGWTHGDG